MSISYIHSTIIQRTIIGLEVLYCTALQARYIRVVIDEPCPKLWECSVHRGKSDALRLVVARTDRHRSSHGTTNCIQSSPPCIVIRKAFTNYEGERHGPLKQHPLPPIQHLTPPLCLCIQCPVRDPELESGVILAIYGRRTLSRGTKAFFVTLHTHSHGALDSNT